MFEALADEITKIAEDKKPLSKEPPKVLQDVVDVGSFIGGVALGSYGGDIIASRLARIQNPQLRSLARHTGAGLAGYLTMKLLPKLQEKAPDAIKAKK